MEWNWRTSSVCLQPNLHHQQRAEAPGPLAGTPGLQVSRCPRRTAASTWYASLLACVIVAGSALIVAMISALVFTG